MGHRPGPILHHPLDVPAPVFTALGIDRDRAFAPGICFNSFDFFIEDSECKGHSFAGFRWARRVRDLWLVSMKFGGAFLRREYYTVRKEHGRYRKVWWADDLSSFNAWRENGAIAMAEPSRER
jgi:hypothetical protein